MKISNFPTIINYFLVSSLLILNNVPLIIFILPTTFLWKLQCKYSKLNWNCQWLRKQNIIKVSGKLTSWKRDALLPYIHYLEKFWYHILREHWRNKSSHINSLFVNGILKCCSKFSWTESITNEIHDENPNTVPNFQVFRLKRLLLLQGITEIWKFTALLQ